MVETKRILLFNKFDFYYIKISNSTPYPKGYNVWMDGSDIDRFRLEGQLASHYYDDVHAISVSVPGQEYIPLELYFEYDSNNSTKTFYDATIYVKRNDTEELWTIPITVHLDSMIFTSRSLPIEADITTKNLLFKEKTSISLVRTNPKLSGNVELVIDSKNSLWLNAYRVPNGELNDVRYQMVPIKSSYAKSIQSYYNTTNDKSVIYTVYNSYPSEISNDLQEQFDSLYSCGCERNDSKISNEEYRIQAPIWINKILPDYFVIFRIDGPITSTSDSSSFDIHSDIIKQSVIVKTFDIHSSENPISKLLQDIQLSCSAKWDSPIEIDHSTQTITYNGIDIKTGLYVSKEDDISEYMTVEHLITDLELYITNGYERNLMICPYLINLTFLFDDSTTENFKSYRYFGLYVNKNELATLEFDSVAQNSITISDQTIVQEPLNINSLDVSLTNNDGVTIFGSLVGGNIPTEQLFDPSKNIWYLQDRLENFHTLSSIKEQSYSTKQSNASTIAISVADATLHTKDLYGVLPKAEYSIAYPISRENGASIVIEFPKKSSGVLRDNDSFSILYEEESTNRKYIWKVVANQDSEFSFGIDVAYTKSASCHIENVMLTTNSIDPTLVDVVYDTIDSIDIHVGDSIRIFNSDESESKLFKINSINKKIESGQTLLRVQYDTFLDSIISTTNGIIETIPNNYYLTYFSPNGTTESVIDNIVTAFSRFAGVWFVCDRRANKLIFKSLSFNPKRDDLLTLHINFSETSTKLDGYSINGIAASLGDIHGDNYLKQKFIGGNSTTNSIVVPMEFAKSLDGICYIQTKKGLSKLKTYNVLGQSLSYVPNIEKIGFFDSIDDEFDFVATEAILTTEDIYSNSVILNTGNQITIYKSFLMEIGIFSIFPLCDFDSDLLTTSPYSYGPTDEQHQYISEYNSDEILPLNSSFAVTGLPSESIIVDRKTINSDWIEYKEIHFTPTIGIQYFNTLSIDNSTKYRFRVISGVPIVKNYIYGLDTNVGNMSTFVRLKNSSISEYDIFKEYAQQTLIPNIGYYRHILKWVSTQGKDCRDNSYRYNLSSVFPTGNFSPIVGSTSQNPKTFSHEWYYLENVPEIISQFDIENPQNNSYHYDRLNKSDLYSVDYDGFLKYFALGYPTEIVNGSTIKKPRTEHFSEIQYRDNKSMLFFRGALFSIGLLDDNNNTIPTDQYNGYKFSAILTYQHTDIESLDIPIRYELVENKKWKSLTLIITIQVFDYKFHDGSLSYSGLYLLKDEQQKIYVDSIRLGLDYSDSKLGNHLILGKGYSFDDNDIISIKAYKPKNYDVGLVNECIPNDTTIDTIRINGVYRLLLRGSYISSINDDTLFISIPRTSWGDRISTPGYFLTETAQQYALEVPFKTFDSWYPGYTIHVRGGRWVGKKKMEAISFSKIVEQLKTKTNVFHTIISTDGIVKTSDSLNISIDYVDPDFINQQQQLTLVSISQKPTELSSIDIIGYSTKQQSINNTVLRRYSGMYRPAFKDIIGFGVRETVDFSEYYGTDFLLANTNIVSVTSIESNLKKISTNKIFKTTSPNYPLIGEFPFDTKTDINPFSTLWDKKAYRLYSTSQTYEQIDGYTIPTNKKWFLGSVVTALPTTLKLNDFLTIEKVNSFIGNSEIEYIDTGKVITIRISYKNSIYRTIKNLGLETEFSSVETIYGLPQNSINRNHFIEQYILDLFLFERIVVYGKPRSYTTGASTIQQHTISDSSRIFQLSTKNIDAYTIESTIQYDPSMSIDLFVEACLSR